MNERKFRRGKTVRSHRDNENWGGIQDLTERPEIEFLENLREVLPSASGRNVLFRSIEAVISRG
jgi:hypothetical protein